MTIEFGYNQELEQNSLNPRSPDSALFDRHIEKAFSIRIGDKENDDTNETHYRNANIRIKFIMKKD